MLKIDGAGTDVVVAANSSGKQHSRRQPAKKLGTHRPPPSPQAQQPQLPPSLLPSSPSAANMSGPQGEAPPLPHAAPGSKVSELLHVCVGLGMAPPEFSYASKQQVSRSAPTPSR